MALADSWKEENDVDCGTGGSTGGTCSKPDCAAAAAKPPTGAGASAKLPWLPLLQNAPLLMLVVLLSARVGAAFGNASCSGAAPAEDAAAGTVLMMDGTVSTVSGGTVRGAAACGAVDARVRPPVGGAFAAGSTAPLLPATLAGAGRPSAPGGTPSPSTRAWVPAGGAAGGCDARPAAGTASVAAGLRGMTKPAASGAPAFRGIARPIITRKLP